MSEVPHVYPAIGEGVIFVKAFWELLSPERPEPGLSPLSLLLGSKTEIFGARAGRQGGREVEADGPTEAMRPRR